MRQRESVLGLVQINHCQTDKKHCVLMRDPYCSWFGAIHVLYHATLWA